VYARGASFVGRAAELGELCKLLDARSLITIVGEGGVGKTRLAREVADTLAASDWLVWWIDLGAATGPSGVRSSFEDSLRPVGRDVSFEELIVERVPAGRCLMVIDNCEHVLDDIVARIELLGSVRPEMRVLATSRVRLGLGGEVAHRLSPLDVPSRDLPSARIGDIASVALLIDRVRDVISDFSLDESNVFDLASIARNSEGVPLAIELVAAAAGAVPLSEIARDLRESLGMGVVDSRREPRRHRSLDASVRWSVDRLDPLTEVAFRRLGAFAESFRFDLAVRVISDTGDRHDRSASRAFVELVEASLVRRLADDRFSLPMAVRTLAVDELDATAESSEVRDRHAEAIADVVEVRASVQTAGDIDEARLRLLDYELPEIRAAIDWQLRRGRPEKAAALIAETYDHAHIRGRYGEVLAQCRTILAHPDLVRAAGARLAATASIVAVMAGRIADSYDFSVRAVSDADDPIVRANAYLERAWSGYYSGLTDGATLWSDIDGALRIAREQDDAELHAVARVRQGSLVIQARSIPEGRTILASVAAGSGLLQSHQLLSARLFQTYGSVVVDLELDSTYSQVLDVIDDCRSAGHIAFESMALATAATITALWGDEDRTDQFLDQAEQLTRQHELPTFANAVQRWRAFAHYRFDRPDTAEHAQRAITMAEATDNAWDAAAAHWLLGLVGLRNDDEGAVEHLHTALDLSTEPGFPFSRIRAELALALVDLRNDEFASGVDRVHEALRRARDHSDLLGLAACFDHLALFECEREASDRAGRFAGAADRIHRRSSVARLPCELGIRMDVEDRLADRCGPDEAARLVAAGGAQDTDAAVQLARRSRGRRSRPLIGWSSLTPTESEVAKVAARGLSNPEIAKLLVMSVHTVKTHLSHVYAKTGVTGRSGLAAEWARRSSTK